MSAWLSDTFFACRFAFKNIIYYRLRSLLVFFSLIVVMTVVLLGLSADGFVKHYFQGTLEARYRTIDMSMRVSFNGQTRFFSITPLYQSDVLDEIAQDHMPFFEINALVENPDGNKLYVKAMSSSLEHLYKLSNLTAFDLASLSDDEVIITDSFASSFGLAPGDDLLLHVGASVRTYEVAAVVEDGGLFAGETIFINKSSSLSFFLSALNPAFAFPPAALTSLYNVIYFNLAEGVTFEQATLVLKDIHSQYRSLDYEESINAAALNQQIQRMTIVFNIITLLVMLGLFFVLHTTFLLVFHEKQRSFAVIRMLGGRTRHVLTTLMIEMLLFFLAALLLSIWLANVVIAQGLAYVDAPVTYRLDTPTILMGGGVALLLLMAAIVYYFIKFGQNTLTEQAKHQGQETALKPVLLLFVLVVSLAVYVLFETSWLADWSGNSRSLIQIALAVVILFSTAFLLVFIFSRWLHRLTPSRLSLNLKVLLSKRAFNQYVTVMLVCFTSLFLIALTNDHMNTKMDMLKHEQKGDFILTNFVSRYEDTYAAVLATHGVASADKVGLYQNVLVVDQQLDIRSLVSLDAGRISLYYGFDIDDHALALLDRSDIKTIVLPERFNALYGYQVGDDIVLYVTPLFPEESFEIAGFFHQELVGATAFVNLHLFDEYQSIANNAILVNASGDRAALQEDLINQFGRHLVVVVDIQKLVNDWLVVLTSGGYYILFILGTMNVFFMIAIAVHALLLFEQMKDGYARFFVLGLSKRNMLGMLAIEQAFLFIVLLVSTWAGYVLLASRLNLLLLFFGEYELVTITAPSIWLGSLTALLVFVLTKWFYMAKVIAIKPSAVLKSHD